MSGSRWAVLGIQGDSAVVALRLLCRGDAVACERPRINPASLAHFVYVHSPTADYSRLQLLGQCIAGKNGYITISLIFTNYVMHVSGYSARAESPRASSCVLTRIIPNMNPETYSADEK